MSIAETNYAHLAPLIGYSSAIISAVLVLRRVWAGGFKKWGLPEEDIPGTAKKISTLLCATSLVVLWYYARPELMDFYIKLIIWSAGICLLSYLAYYAILSMFIYKKEVPNPDSRGPDTVETKILGGIWLKKEARESKNRYRIPVQELFKGAAYDPDLLWSPFSRVLTKLAAVLLLISTLLAGTVALTGGGFTTQVRLTGKPAAGVVDVKDAPGLQ